jgi:hypothetical protein
MKYMELKKMKVMLLDKKPNFSRIAVRNDVERARVKFVYEFFKYFWKHSKKARRIIDTRWGTLVFVRKK